MPAVTRGAWGKMVNRFFPDRGILVSRAPETMMKTFEVSASGCAPVCDFNEELGELGYVDGQNMISYRSFEEMVERLGWADGAPDEVLRIGQEAASLAKARHSWDHRAAELERVLRSLS
jgi:spore maturation protein CgeB